MDKLGDYTLLQLLVCCSLLGISSSCSQAGGDINIESTYPYPLVETVSHQPTATVTPTRTVTPTMYISPTATSTAAAADTSTPSPTRTRLPFQTYTPTATGIYIGGGVIYETFTTWTQTVCTNKWIRHEADRNIVVYGCGFGSGYDTGYIVVMGLKGVGDGFALPTPTNTGYVRVVGATGDKVIFESRLGYIYIFDLSKEEFVSSLID
jgi:hypothetical protein